MARALAWGIALLALGAGATANADTVVVVVDTSASMARNDPDRLAVLSLLMLADIVDPAADDFVVVPFDDSAATPAALSAAAPISRRDHPDTSSFRDALLRNVTQDGQRTLFAPQIRRALDVFDARGASGRHVLVLLTDGASNDERGDLTELQATLLPRMRSLDVQAWFVALGSRPAAQPALSRFFGTHRTGGSLHAPDAVDLPGVLASALARGTGRMVETFDLRSGARRPLDADQALAQLDVLAVAPGVVDDRSFALTSPSGTWQPGPGDDVEGLVRARTLHGYRRARVVAPTSGRWTLQARRALSFVLVRRHAYEIDLELTGSPEVPAGRPGCFSATVRSRAHAGAAAQAVTSPSVLAGLEVRLLLRDPATGQTRTPLTLLDDGVAPSDRVAGDGVFGGCVVAREQDAGTTLVGTAELSSAGDVWATSPPAGLDILPPMRLGTTPSAVSLGGTGALTTGDRSCASVELVPPTGQLPEDPTALRVALQTRDGAGNWTAGSTGRPADALQISVDGTLLPANGSPVDVAWSEGVPRHEICIVVGRRDAGGTVAARVLITPAAGPYLDAGVEGGIDVSAVLETPSLWERWGLTALTLGLLALLVGFVAWLRRPMPLPAGLLAQVWQGDPDRPSGAPSSVQGRSGQPLREAGVTVVVRGDQLEVDATRPVEARAPDGTWRTLLNDGGRIDVVPGVTYRVADRYFRLSWRLR